LGAPAPELGGWCEERTRSRVSRALPSVPFLSVTPSSSSSPPTPTSHHLVCLLLLFTAPPSLRARVCVHLFVCACCPHYSLAKLLKKLTVTCVEKYSSPPHPHLHPSPSRPPARLFSCVFCLPESFVLPRFISWFLLRRRHGDAAIHAPEHGRRDFAQSETRKRVKGKGSDAHQAQRMARQQQLSARAVWQALIVLVAYLAGRLYVTSVCRHSSGSTTERRTRAHSRIATPRLTASGRCRRGRGAFCRPRFLQASAQA
jgi:hypothetical protein